MARKNLLAGISERKSGSAVSPSAPAADRALPLAFAGKGALGAVTRTIDELAARAATAKDLEARLTAGNVVVDLDPAAIDRSFVVDRMEGTDDSYTALLEAIREHGQDSPILVRPNARSPGRYQVAFGHRRLRIAAELGRPVKAVVKPLSDRELVIAQGQENSARTDLSFIERVRFARQLQELEHDRETIMLALSVDKTVVSRMISVATAIPGAIIDAIGPAPGIGRDRWLDLAAVLQAAEQQRVVEQLVQSPDFNGRSSDDRFEWIRSALEDPGRAGKAPARKSGKRGQATYWSSRDGKKLARISASQRSFTLTIDSRLAPEFGEYLLQELDRLYEAYSRRAAG